ncbi:hypothetical protein RB195_021904 [Necator americanus]|uniref:Uncharacterized protein n=1 Tax=Necator americanus TaxID=51031 RepID=A0ABR1EDC8_NECAM
MANQDRNRHAYAIGPPRLRSRFRLSLPRPSFQRADGISGKFFRLIEEMNRRSTAAVRTPIGFNSLLKVETEERQGPVPDRSLFNSAVDIMRKQLSKVPRCRSSTIWTSLGQDRVGRRCSDIRFKQRNVATCRQPCIEISCNVQFTSPP